VIQCSECFSVETASVAIAGVFARPDVLFDDLSEVLVQCPVLGGKWGKRHCGKDLFNMSAKYLDVALAKWQSRVGLGVGYVRFCMRVVAIHEPPL